MEFAVLLAEQGHWLIAAVVMGILWLMERRHRDTSGKFRGLLEEHDRKNEADFKRLDDKVDAVKQEVHVGFVDLRERMARMEGMLARDQHRDD